MSSLSFDDIQSRIASFAATPGSGSDDNEAATPALQMPSRCDAAMDAIKSYIIQKGLKPGDPLPNEAALCEELGVSRSSVREAIRKLEALHIVKVAHGKGTFVGDLSLDPLVETLSFRAMTGGTANLPELEEVVQIRRILDLGIAEPIVAAMEGTDQPKLMDLAEQMEQCADKHETFIQQDIAFHSIMLRSVHNNVLAQLANSLWLVHMAILPQLGLSVSSDLHKTAQAHKDMVIAAMDGDVDAYCRAVIMHYEPIEELIARYLAMADEDATDDEVDAEAHDAE